MKILFVAEYYPPKVMGGGEINLAQTAQALAAKHEITVLTSFFKGLPREEVVQGVRIVRRLRTGSSTATVWGNLQRRCIFPAAVEKEVQKEIKEFSPDIIHFIGTSIIAAPKLGKYQKKMFATIESYPTLCPKGDRLFQGRQECKVQCTLKHFIFCQKESDEIGKMKNKWYLKYNPLFLWITFRYFQKLNRALRSCHLISISSYVQQLLQHYEQNSVVIPNAFDAAPFQLVRRTARVQSDISRKPLLLYVGALLTSKGPQILLEALRGVDCRAELYGAGVLKEELQKYIAQHNLDAKIFAPVPYEQMPEIYARAEVVVFPSLWPEPFGRIPLEAHAAAKPLIASNIGAIPEMVHQNDPLVPPGDPAMLRKAIITVLGRRQKDFKPSTISHRSDRYSQERIMSQYLKAYREMR